MQKFLAIALVVLTAVAGIGAASAQVRVQGYQTQGPAQRLLPRGQGQAPRLQPRVKQVRPNLILIPPSAAVRSALGAVPNAKPLGVRTRGPLYIVKLKQGGTIVQVGVNRTTGAVTRLP